MTDGDTTDGAPPPDVPPAAPAGDGSPPPDDAHGPTSAGTPFSAADEPGPEHAGPHPALTARRAGLAALTLGALGIVFGDIGTSPLYALQTVFSADDHAVKANTADVYGVISLVFWSITMIVSIKFVTFIMRADNDGEGGIMALIALVETAPLKRRSVQALLVAAGLFGVSLFYGDGMITPAISVLSAVEGMEVVSPSLSSLVVPIAAGILAGLFIIQRFGTHVIGRMFGPVMVVWFVILAVLGIGQIADEPQILKALSPSYGLEFFTKHPSIAFISLGSIVLVVTGAEALYADMGHFGRRPISRAWFFVVFPALTLNYLGQGSLILENPSAISNPFYLLVPEWGRIPMVVLATVATVIASQAVISGAFSVSRQAVQLGFLPRLSIRHTSDEEIGQVYAPAVNWALFVAVLTLVVTFGSSAKLASAYGVAVTGTLTIDALLFLVIVRTLWRKPLWMAIVGGVVFLTIDLLFLTANLTKIFHGGWFPLLIGLLMFLVLTTWALGRKLVTAARIQQEGELQEFVTEVHRMAHPLLRVPGTGVYLNASRDTTPLALRAMVEHNHTMHEQVVIVTLITTNVPFVPDEERVSVDDLGYDDDGITHLTLTFGFQDTPDVPRALALAKAEGIEGDIDVEHASYYLSHIDIVATAEPGMARWRKRLFVTLAHNAASPAEYFRLPRTRTVTLGSQIEL